MADKKPPAAGIKPPGRKPPQAQKPGKSKGKGPAKKRVKVSRMGYYIIIFGWLSIAINFLLAFEWAKPDEVLDRLMAAELSSLAFRAVMLILPLIFSILGYMVYQREKILWRAIATGRKLEHMNVSLQTNYEKLSSQMSEKDKSGLTDHAIDEIKCLHRQTKTSLNILSSLMEAQSKKVTDEAGSWALKEFQRRLKTVEFIHEAMTKGEQCTAVNIADYLKFLSNEIIHSYGETKVRLTIDVKPWTFTSDRAFYCGLIVSELVSNAMKFAFAEDDEKPTIRVTLDKDAEGGALLRVSDNGVGMPEGLDMEMIDTLGLKIVAKLTRSLKGTTETHVMAGTSVDVRFPLDDS